MTIGEVPIATPVVVPIILSFLDKDGTRCFMSLLILRSVWIDMGLGICGAGVVTYLLC